MAIIKLKSGYEIIVDDEDLERVSQFNWYVTKSHVSKSNVFRWLPCSKQSGHGKKIWLHNFILNSDNNLPIKKLNGQWNDYRKENLARIIRKPFVPKDPERYYMLKNMTREERQVRTKNNQHINCIKWQTKQRRQSPCYVIKKAVSHRIWAELKGKTRTGRTIQYLGCTIEEFKKYIEQQFDVNMSWVNHGSYWHLDHIRPCISFDLTQDIQMKQCFHFTNYQPLEARENKVKGGKLLWFGKVA
jgi:hypothetical protein